MALTSDEIVRISNKVRLGLLRRDEPERTWGGLGRGSRCDGCERPIVTDLEIEADFDLGATTLRFHVACFLAWYRVTDVARVMAV